MSEEIPKAQFEKMFDNKTARVLDHMLIHKYFDYSKSELTEINRVTADELDKILDTLANWKLITITTIKEPKRYKMTDNEVSQALERLAFAMATQD